MKQLYTDLETAFPSLSGSDAFAFYENARDRLPKARFPARSSHAANLGELADQFDVFVFDAYGVLNRGMDAVPGAAQRVKALQDLGKKTFVLTNGASFTAEQSQAKFDRMGMAFAMEDIVASRLATFRALEAHTDVSTWGVITGFSLEQDELPVRFVQLNDNPDAFDYVDGFLLLSVIGYQPEQYARLRNALKKKPRPLMVANPDVVAPQDGFFSLEPGFFSHSLADELGLAPEFYGKPFASVFEIVQERLPQSVPPSRIAMMGDTLHTDILGAAAIGWRTVLCTEYGLFAGQNVQPYINESGIVPDFIVPSI
ncbi:MAG: HAD hydrolase-like protein [Hyphomicrobiales bacterium]